MLIFLIPTAMLIINIEGYFIVRNLKVVVIKHFILFQTIHLCRDFRNDTRILIRK